MSSIYLKTLTCNEETSEVGHDEPYVLVTAVDLASSVQIAGVPVPLPSFDVILYGPYGYVDSGDWRSTGEAAQSFWGINGGSSTLTDPNNTIFLVSVMENDDGNPEALRGIVKGVIGSSVLSTLSATRANKVAALIRDVGSVTGTPTGGPNFDDQVGPTQELLFTADQLAAAEQGMPARQSLWVRGDGGMYTMLFEAVNDFGVYGAIRDKWEQLNFAAGPLGRPTSDEASTFDGIGRARTFAGGFVSWHPEIGAFAVWGAIGERWVQIGREQFGYPLTDETPTADGRGRYNEFRAMQLSGRPEASIYWSPDTGAHEVYGAIRDKWSEMNRELGSLGYPIAPEEDAPGGRQQRFQRGIVFWSAGGGAVVR
jgi:hypothetical protein